MTGRREARAGRPGACDGLPALSPGAGRPLPRATPGEAWAAAGEAMALQRDYPGVDAGQARTCDGYGVAARWRAGHREFRVIGDAGGVRAALKQDPPSPAGEASPPSSPAGHDERRP